MKKPKFKFRISKHQAVWNLCDTCCSELFVHFSILYFFSLSMINIYIKKWNMTLILNNSYLCHVVWSEYRWIRYILVSLLVRLILYIKKIFFSITSYKWHIIHSSFFWDFNRFGLKFSVKYLTLFLDDNSRSQLPATPLMKRKHIF